MAAADELFCNRGIAAVGVDLIAEHSGVTKRTLYNQFGSKDQRHSRQGRHRTLRGTADLERDQHRGCAFINALAELPDPSHPAYRIAANQKLWLLNLFKELAATAGCSRPATLATQLLVLHEGAVATQPLSLDSLPESTDLARVLVQASTSPRQ